MGSEHSWPWRYCTSPDLGRLPVGTQDRVPAWRRARQYWGQIVSLVLEGEETALCPALVRNEGQAEERGKQPSGSVS